MRTKVIIPRYGEICLNVRTMAHTGIRILTLDGATAQPIPGYTWEEALPIGGDHLYARPRWRELEDIAGLADRAVRVEVAMRKTESFAFRVECKVYIACEELVSSWFGDGGLNFDLCGVWGRTNLCNATCEFSRFQTEW